MAVLIQVGMPPQMFCLTLSIGCAVSDLLFKHSGISAHVQQAWGQIQKYLYLNVFK